MTAMMAFFLVLWIISATDKNTKTLIARYFNPVKVEEPAKAQKGIHGDCRKRTRPMQPGEEFWPRRAPGRPRLQNAAKESDRRGRPGRCVRIRQSDRRASPGANAAVA